MLEGTPPRGGASFVLLTARAWLHGRAPLGFDDDGKVQRIVSSSGDRQLPPVTPALLERHRKCGLPTPSLVAALSQQYESELKPTDIIQAQFRTCLDQTGNVDKIMAEMKQWGYRPCLVDEPSAPP